MNGHKMAWAGTALMLVACHALADNGTPSTAWKLTTGYYQYQHDQGKDINLRWQRDASHVWLGHYEDHEFGGQDRVGLDTSVDVGDLVSLQPSLQAATGGFVGGSLNAQIGHGWYGLLGWGRTNLKPYFNLNFDPNDAVTIGAGREFANGQTWSTYVVHDDRLHTGQTDWHLTARVPVDGDRLTLDVMRKSGQSDVGYIKAWALSVGWDFPSWFVRVARDPNQNFSAQDAWRVSGGLRF